MTTNTLPTYINRIERLSNLYGSNKGIFIQDYERVIEIIEENYNTPSSKKSMFVSIIWFLKNVLGIETGTLIDIYTKKVNEYRKEENVKRNNNVVSEEEKTNWTTYKELSNITKELGKKIKFKIYGSKREQQKQLKEIMEYVVMVLYTLQPPIRLDYYNVLVYNKEETPNEEENYIQLTNKRNLFLHMNYFKNVNKIGKQQLKLPSNVSQVIKNWVELKKQYTQDKHLLFNIGGGMEFKTFTTSNTFGKYLKRILEKYTGKQITIDLLRRIYETELINSKVYRNMTNTEQEKQHLRLLHSKQIAQEYRRVFK